jgi:hypothetical protein
MQPSVHGLAIFGGYIIVGLETGEGLLRPWAIDSLNMFALEQPFLVICILRLYNMGLCCAAKGCASMVGGVLVCCRGRTYVVYRPESN